MRRRLNRCLFSKILVDAETPVTAELRDPPTPKWVETYLHLAKKAVPAAFDGALGLKALEGESPALVSVGPGSTLSLS